MRQTAVAQRQVLPPGVKVATLLLPDWLLPIECVEHFHAHEHRERQAPGQVALEDFAVYARKHGCLHYTTRVMRLKCDTHTERISLDLCERESQMILANQTLPVRALAPQKRHQPPPPPL